MMFFNQDGPVLCGLLMPVALPGLAIDHARPDLSLAKRVGASIHGIAHYAQNVVIAPSPPVDPWPGWIPSQCRQQDTLTLERHMHLPRAAEFLKLPQDRANGLLHAEIGVDFDLAMCRPAKAHRQRKL